jgi:hypothetical protein
VVDIHPFMYESETFQELTSKGYDLTIQILSANSLDRKDIIEKAAEDLKELWEEINSAKSELDFN